MADPRGMTDEMLDAWMRNFQAQPPTMDYMAEHCWAGAVSQEAARRREAAAVLTVTSPAPFAGSPEEAARNRASHAFGEERCFYCDCKPWHLAASYPCGAEVPQATMSEPEYEARTGFYGAAFAGAATYPTR